MIVTALAEAAGQGGAAHEQTRYIVVSSWGEIETTVDLLRQLAVPGGPISPNLRRSVTLSLVSGLTLALGLVFLIDYLDSRLKTPQDLKTYLGVPFLGMIPAVQRGKEAVNPLLTDVGNASFAEAFKTVRTNVLFSSADDGLRTLVVTSAGPGEGKSICSANIAVALAQTGLRVLLVDADMRPVGLARDESGRASHILLSRSEYASIVKARDLWLRSQLDLAEVEVAPAEASD